MLTIRRLAVLAPLLTAGMAAVSAHGQALPPPPYQTDQADGRSSFSSPQTLDRYGGGMRGPVSNGVRASGGAPNSSLGAEPSQATGSRLAWAGKVEPQTQQPGQVGGGWSSMSQRWGAQTTTSGGYAQQAWRPFRPQMTRPQQQAQQPAQQSASQPASLSSIYDPPPAQGAPTLPPPPAAQYRVAQGQTGDSGPRFYSVHREYGIQPDAIPLPPQFFGATADLSTPNTESLVKRSVNGTTRNVPSPDDQTNP